MRLPGRGLQRGPHQRLGVAILLLEMLGAKVKPFGPQDPVRSAHPPLLPLARFTPRAA